jgi:pimeloyl-ACP methyl ester carboxylesterase
MSMDWKHGYAFTNGIRMHYVEAGAGPLVLLCHGWPESWFSWRHQIAPLVDAGFRVVAMDQRGYGETEAPLAADAYHVLNLVGDLVGLVRALGEEEAILVGHDWGSIVVQYAALLRPDLFRKLAILSVPYLPRHKLRPAVRFDVGTQERQFYQHYFQEPGRAEREFELNVRRSLLGVLYTASGDAQFHDAHKRMSFARFDKGTRIIDNLAIPDALPEWLPAEDLDYLVGRFETAGFRGGINWYRNLDRNWEMTPFLDGAKILQPTVFIAGELDGVLKMARDEYANLANNVPNLVGNHLIPRGGHFIQQERPEEVTRLLLSFLDGR